MHYRVAIYERNKNAQGHLESKVMVKDGHPLEAHKDAPRLDTGMQRILMGHPWDRFVHISECGFGDDKCRQYEDVLEKPIEAIG